MKRTNKGRITRIDQAWDVARREAIDRGRIQDPDIAHAEALLEPGTSVVQFVYDPEASKPPSTAEQLGDIQTLAVPLKFVSSALLAAAKDDIRYYLNGVFLHAQDGELRVCGTDGHRFIVSRFELPQGGPIPAWALAGVIIPRNDLAQALPILEKNAVLNKLDIGEPALLIDFGIGHSSMTLRAVNGFASFKITPVDGKFPDYAQVLASNASTLARGDMEAMQAAAINTKYLKGAADIAAKLGAVSVRSFVGSDEKAATFFTFDGAPDTVLIVMPMRSGEAIGDGVVKMLGSNGIRASLAAFRAHITRTVKALGSVKDKTERMELQARKSQLETKIAHLLNLTGGSNQLTHKAA